jgi:hypothetical protein
MFNDLGRVLSKASGAGLNYGPANDFGGLGYLKGAFDDHLYGSTFYGQHLYSPDHILPWSTAAVTIELDSGRGQDPDRLGNLEGIYNINSPDDGTLPMGIRMSLAVCHLMVPEIEGNITRKGIFGETRLSLSGISSYTITSVTVDSEEIQKGSIVIQSEEHPFLPIRNITFDIRFEDTVEEHEIEATVNFDEEWDDLKEGSDPQISPQCILSLSRSGTEGSRTMNWVIEGTEIEPPEVEELKILEIDSDVLEAGSIYSIVIDIPESLGTPLSMIINTTVDWNTESSYIRGSEIVNRTDTYEFVTPLLEGDGLVEVNLTTDQGSYYTNSTIRVYPKVYILEIIRKWDTRNIYDVMIGVDGSLGPTTIYYGISRSLTMDWGDEGWTMGPIGLVAPSWGPYSFELNVSNLGGDVYFRVCNFPGSSETYRELSLDSNIQITQPPARIENNTVVIGPSIIYARWDGLIEFNPNDWVITYSIRIKNLRTEKEINTDLQWRNLDMLDEINKAELFRLAAEIGMSEDQITGCWLGVIDVPEEDGNYTIRISVEGDKREHFDFDIVGFGSQYGAEESFTIGETTEDEKEKRDFPTSIVIFVVIVVVIIFIISIIRANAHLGDRNDIEEQGPREGPAPFSSEE